MRSGKSNETGVEPFILTQKLILHIGYTKTGSTSIQAQYEKPSGVDAATGFWSPTLSLPGGRYRFAIESAGDPAVPSPTWDALGRLMLGTPGWRFCFISSETLVRVNPEFVLKRIERLPVPVEPLVIVYLRSHASWLVSDFTQNVKIGRYNGTLENYLAKCRVDLNYFNVLSPWLEVFKERLVVRSYDHALSTYSGVLGDFGAVLNSFGVEMPNIESEMRKNTTPRRPELSLMMAVLNVVNDAPPHLKTTIAQKLVLDKSIFGHDRLTFPASLSSKLIDICFEDTRRLDSAFFAGHEFEKALLNCSGSDDEADLSLECHFDPREIELIRAFSESLKAMVQSIKR